MDSFTCNKGVSTGTLPPRMTRLAVAIEGKLIVSLRPVLFVTILSNIRKKL
jgi:hypothetical protein